MQSLAVWIEGGVINTFVTSTYWLWPLLEIIHFIGLSLLFGGLLVIDGRLAGFLRHINLAAIHELSLWVYAGFGLNLLSGVLFFFGDPYRYSENIGFRCKLLLLLVAGLNAMWFFWKVNPLLRALAPDADPPAQAKAIGLLSLLAWTGVLLFGRLIPYVGSG